MAAIECCDVTVTNAFRLRGLRGSPEHVANSRLIAAVTNAFRLRGLRGSTHSPGPWNIRRTAVVTNAFRLRGLRG